MADVDINAQDRHTDLTATGGETALAADFPIYDETEFTLTRTRAGVVAELVLATDYTVSDVGEEDGFTVTLAIAAAAGDQYRIDGVTAIARVGSYTDSNFKAAALNRELDRVNMIAQELRRDADAALQNVGDAGDAASEAAGYRNAALVLLKKTRGLFGQAIAALSAVQLYWRETINFAESAHRAGGVAQAAAAAAATRVRAAHRARQASENAAAVWAGGSAVMFRRAQRQAAAAASSAAALTDDQIVLKAQVFG